MAKSLCSAVSSKILFGNNSLLRGVLRNDFKNLTENKSLPFFQSHLFPASSFLKNDAFHFSSASNGSDSEQEMLRNAAENFASKEFLPHASKWDEEKYFPVEVLRKAAKLGFGAIYCSPNYGGSGFTRSDASIIFEQLAYADVSTTAYLTIHNMNCSLLDRFGNDEQRTNWLPSLASMDLFSSYCLTEPGSGSDAASIQTSVKKGFQTSDYVLNGCKVFISGGGVSDVYFVMARTSFPSSTSSKGISCFLVEKNSKGLNFGSLEKKMGWNSQPTCSVLFDEVRVPSSHMIGEDGHGFHIAMDALNGGRINIASCSVGGAQFCIDKAIEYSKSRKQFGKCISDFQNTRFRLADMATDVEAARCLVLKASSLLDLQLKSKSKSKSKSSFDFDASQSIAASAMAKRFATDVCHRAANDALQIFGGYGYLKDYQIERYVRDLRVHTILEGTNEIMRTIIAKHLCK